MGTFVNIITQNFSMGSDREREGVNKVRRHKKLEENSC